MENSEIEILRKELEKERKARILADEILQQKSRNLLLISKELKLKNLELQSNLDQKSNQLQGIFENINDAYVVIDLDGKVLNLNENAEELFGFKYDEVNKPSIFNFIHKEDIEYALKSLEKLKKEGYLTNYISRIITKSKEVKWIQINISLVFDKRKKPTKAQGIVRDITDIKELEYQKENILKELKESNKELQEYAHIVSHDLKSPLRSLNALVNWVKTDNKEIFNETTIDNFKLIEETIESMDNLITDILEYSSTRLNPKYNADVDLNELIFDLKKILFIPTHIKLNIEGKLPVINGDKTKFKQIFINLISNAVKFNDKEEGFINLSCEENEEFYQFSIEDNGIGVEEKYYDKIFELFQSLEKSKDSSGVGLSIVKKIVNLYQGQIWLESKPNIGTKFIFTLKK